MRKMLIAMFAAAFAVNAVAGDCFWIWGAASVAPGRSFSYFRLPVELDDDVLTAELFSIADDAMELYINGGGAVKQVFMDQAEKRIRIRRYEFKSQLKKGKNILAVVVVNQGGPGGVIMKGAIRLANGKTVDLASNGQWKAVCAPQFKTNAWKMPAFDDAAWKRAFQLGDAGMKPWANMSDAVNFFGLPGGKK